MDIRRQLQMPGEHAVDVPITCTLTRFGLRGARQLPPMYRDYRRLAADARERAPRGLLTSAFLVEDPSTCYTLSIWSDRPAFSAAVPRHVEVAREAFGRLRIDEDSGPELWSTKWQLVSVSNNLNWPDLDLRRALAEHAAADAATGTG